VTVGVLRLSAFADAGRGGNPAGVVLDAGGLGDVERLALAAEVGYSETAFVEPGEVPGEYRVRFWSPLAEVGFCGHATVATAVALAGRDGPGDLVFQTAVGPVPVTTRIGPGQGAGLRDGAGPGETVATLSAVRNLTRPASADEVAATLKALRWKADDVDGRYPVHVADAGNEHLVLAVRDRARLADLDYDYPALDRLMAERGWTTVHLVQAETPLLFHARDPFPPGGVVEDPATGAAALAFGGYLRALGLVVAPARVEVRQGEDLGRPSRLLLDVPVGEAAVRVTGTAVPIR
jgi:PhzF family phenazine biosynthesis protein